MFLEMCTSLTRHIRHSRRTKAPTQRYSCFTFGIREQPRGQVPQRVFVALFAQRQQEHSFADTKHGSAGHREGGRPGVMFKHGGETLCRGFLPWT